MNNIVNIERPEILTEIGQQTLRRLMRVGFEFERRLAKIPVIQRLDLGTFSLEDYQKLILHLRPQVVEGARWITRCASSFDSDHADIRSVIIGHAQDEHRDYEVLEADYVACGGKINHLRAQKKNIGSEALHGYLMYRASLPNPSGLLGAMWIIEGLGEKMATNWADRIERLTGVGKEKTRFLRYHGINDDSHMDKLYGLIDRLCKEQDIADDIVRTAQVVSRLYGIQLEEIDSGE